MPGFGLAPRSRKLPRPQPLSLVQHFSAPDDYRGVFGWLCGYSADAAFLNQAAERFTSESSAQRAARGSAAIALLLDPSQPAISIVDAPGIVHLAFRRGAVPPFRLLHAKVALLGFRHTKDAGRWRIRLIVSTGNWTRQTLEESLDLAWRIDICAEDLEEADDVDLTLRCTDVAAAWSMFKFLQEWFDLRILNASNGGGEGESTAAQASLVEWIEQCRQGADGESRFIDNRKQSLLARLPEAIALHAGEVKRNYLGMGSGFFEGQLVGGSSEVPAVLDRIARALIGHKLQTQTAEVDIFVNPAACQAVAQALPAIIDRNWSVRPASPMTHLFGAVPRNLHAKFLFGAKQHGGSDACIAPWVYLGSGNLTGPGFVNAMSTHGGNLEAGVIFDPGSLYWTDSHGAEHDVTRLLPLQWAKAVETAADLQSGDKMPQLDSRYLSAPIAWFSWRTEGEDQWLVPDSPMGDGWSVINADGSPCVSSEDGVEWMGPQPRQVQLEWTDSAGEHVALVPVLDEFGRLAATPLRALAIEEIWSELASFPLAPPDDDGDDGGNASSDPTSPAQNRRAPLTAAYPIRQMMELIEQIAQRQTAVPAADWSAWCARLEQTLSRAAESPVVSYFHSLALNPLSALRHAPFRPSYAEDGSSEAGRRYETVIDRLETQWDTARLGTLGGTAC